MCALPEVKPHGRMVIGETYIYTRAQALPGTVHYANGKPSNGQRRHRLTCQTVPQGPRGAHVLAFAFPFLSLGHSIPSLPRTNLVPEQVGGDQTRAEHSTRTNGGFFRGSVLRAPAAALPARVLRGAEPPAVVVVDDDGLVRRDQARGRQPRALRLLGIPLHRRLEAAGLRPQVQEHGAERVELHPVGAGQGLVRGGGVLRQGQDGGEQRRRRVVLQRQGHGEAVLPRRQEPRRRHPQQGPPQALQEQVRRRLPLRPPLRRLPAQHRLPAAVPDLRRRAGRQPAAVRHAAAAHAPEHGLPRLQLHLRDVFQHRRLRRRGVPAGEEARAAGHDGVGRADAHRHDHRALLPAAGPVLVLHPHGHPGDRLRRRHRRRRARLPPQRGRAQERGRAQGARHRHPRHGVAPGAGDPGAAGQDVQGAAVLELVPPQHRAGGDRGGDRQHLPGPLHRAGDQRLHRLLRRLRRRLGGRHRRLRDEALLRRRRLIPPIRSRAQPW